MSDIRLLRRVPEGTCPECAVCHDPAAPHDCQSLYYQYGFYEEHGRWPTWEDAMAHCDDEVKSIWENELTLIGIDIKGGV
ncbi:MAG: hypothetical protein FWD72_01745 [Eggerthellaceae bacterium]|nr:hypothetical protein [Eggerthellaceae bacterium]